MKAKFASETIDYRRNGIIVRIRPTIKNGVTRFVLDYRLNGQRKLVWRSSLAAARAAANEAIDKITAGHGEVLNLKSADAHAYIRARAKLDGSDGEPKIDFQIDEAVSEFADAYRLLAGRATIIETVRDWLRRNNGALPKKSVAEAGDDCLAAQKADGKTQQRITKLSGPFKSFAADNDIQLAEITPARVSQWLAGLQVSERTKRNYRDALGFLCRWAILRGYLAKGTDWLEGVQNYSARKIGEIEIYTPHEITRLLLAAGDMTPFIAIGAFAGLRHAEIARLDWREIDLEDGWIEVCAAKSKTGERRLVPIHDNLKKWLAPYRPPSGNGPVTPYANTTKQILKTAAATKRPATANTPEISAVEWRHNALRHSFISYRVAETADVPRVADEAGNSPAIIRQHYLRRVKPKEAAEWFAILPPEKPAVHCRTHRRRISAKLDAREIALAQNVRICSAPKKTESAN
jgi:integrase